MSILLTVGEEHLSAGKGLVVPMLMRIVAVLVRDAGSVLVGDTLVRDSRS